MRLITYLLILSCLCLPQVLAVETALADLKNYRVNSTKMLSSGLPTQQHFEKLKEMGVHHVIDLILGDRSDETQLMKELNLNYHNIAVEWSNPTLENFKDYALLVEKYSQQNGKILTHCRLNWRGAVFTYLYQIKYLNVDEKVAKADLLAVWQPNEVWQAFIDKVKSQTKPH